MKILTLDQADQWDAIVRSFKDYDVYWLSGYVKGFKLHGDGEPILFVYDDGLTRGVNVVMQRDVSRDERFRGKVEEGRFFDFSTPYGYGGWLIEGSDSSKLFAEYNKWCKDNKIISEFVRFHPMVKNHEFSESFYEIIQLGEVVHMELSTPESIWQNITSKNRNMIRKAVKNDIKIYNGRFPEIYERFRTVYNGTMDKDEADAYYYFTSDYYKSLLNDLPQNAQIFWAEKDQRVIAASIMLSANGYMNYHLSGSIREYSSLAPTNLLLYEAALWGSANGCNVLYLGGGVGSGQDSLFKFKRAFYKGSLNHFYIGKKIYDEKTYMELAHIRGEESLNNNFFPIYRS